MVYIWLGDLEMMIVLCCVFCWFVGGLVVWLVVLVVVE